MNLTESMKLTDGYKFVWEFTPSQGNGTITAVGLTSKQGGANAYGSEVAVDTTLLQIKKVSLDDGDGFINDLFRTVTVDFENAKLYSLGYASNTVTIKRYRICQSGQFLRKCDSALDQDQEERLHLYGRTVDAFQCYADDDGKLQGRIQLSVREQKCCSEKRVSVCAVL